MTGYDKQILLIRVLLLFTVFVLLGGAIVFFVGIEIPFREMRRQATDSTGYQPPPRVTAPLVGRVTRSGGVIRLPFPEPEQQRLSKVQAATPLPQGMPRLTATANPLAKTATVVAEGVRLYLINCSPCHGSNGTGNGTVAPYYNPHPANLTQLTSVLPEPMIFRVITNGIRSTPTASAGKYLPKQWMAFGNITSDQERWAIVTYLKSAFGGD